MRKTIAILALFMVTGCSAQQHTATQPVVNQEVVAIEIALLQVGAAQLPKYLPMLAGKRVAMVVNQTSAIGQMHLVDSLLTLGVDIKAIFAPEHGFRGDADAGAFVKDGKDARTGLPIISLYGKNKKPTAAQLENIDLIIFDIQDVGARFYTYITTMHYVMEACAAYGKTLLVLDRPNPNGHYIDGPVLDTANLRSFVGMHPIPIVHGLTVGELARMINGEGWLPKGDTCALAVIPCVNYTHETPYSLPIKPSPNLPNSQAIRLYPSLALFEGTDVSVGRGTDMQFQVVGHPSHAKEGAFSFTPQPMPGAMQPLQQGKVCYGKDLREASYPNAFFLDEVIHFYKESPSKDTFFNSFFAQLAGTKALQKQIAQGMSQEAIRATWQTDLEKYRKMREKYLLYP